MFVVEQKIQLFSLEKATLSWHTVGSKSNHKDGRRLHFASPIILPLLFPGKRRHYLNLHIAFSGLHEYARLHQFHEALSCLSTLLASHIKAVANHSYPPIP